MQHLSSPPPARRTWRQLWVLTMLMALLAAIGTTPVAANARAANRQTEDPLTIHLDSMSASLVTDDDLPVTITGTVTNETDEQWSEINLYAFRSVAPILDSPTLAASAATDPTAYVGERVVTLGTEATVAVLEPGGSADFSLTVPRSELGLTAAGVYWIGVHALGATESAASDGLADGRARTFIPVVAPRGRNAQPVEAAIVLPLRKLVWNTPDGRVDQTGQWSRTLTEGGRLASLLQAGDPAQGRKVTWLVDPAVLYAVARLAAGNPPRSLAPDPAAPPVEGTQPPPSPDGEDTTTITPEPTVDPAQQPTPEEQALAATAQAWLDRFKTVTANQTLLALPYGDLDVSAAAVHGPDYYPLALATTAEIMGWLGLAYTPALAPPDGVLSPEALAAAPPETTILLADTSFADVSVADQSLVEVLGHKVVVTSNGASAGGPGPTAPDDPLALRQRLLSEAALRLQAGNQAPIVQMLPADWQPGDAGPLFSGLDEPWLDLIGIGDISTRESVTVAAEDVAYIAEDQAAELDGANFGAAQLLTSRADLLAGLLTSPNLVRRQTSFQVLESLSSGHRAQPGKAALSARAAAGRISDQLASVTIDAPDAVTLLSDTGQLGIDIVNGLDQAVTVQVVGQLSDDLQLEDLGPQQVAAGSRSRILPSVIAGNPGIHEVRLTVTDAQGRPVGASTTVQVRAAQVSGLIWLLIAGGAALLFGTIALRLVRRLRGHGSNTTEPDPDPEPAA